MADANKRYVYGNVAEKLEYNIYEENGVLKEKKKQKQNNKVKQKAICVVSLLFCLGIMLLLRYSVVTELSHKVNSVNKEYTELVSNNASLKVDLQRKTDLGKIAEIASSKLGMQKPDEYQIVYVDVQRKDYSIVSDAYTQKKQNGNLLADIMVKINTFAHLLI